MHWMHGWYNGYVVEVFNFENIKNCLRFDYENSVGNFILLKSDS